MKFPRILGLLVLPSLLAAEASVKEGFDLKVERARPASRFQ
jgi:hypothetical protein